MSPFPPDPSPKSIVDTKSDPTVAALLQQLTDEIKRKALARPRRGRSRTLPLGGRGAGAIDASTAQAQQHLQEEEEEEEEQQEEEEAPSPVPRVVLNQNLKSSRRDAYLAGKIARRDDNMHRESKFAGLIFMCNRRTKKECFLHGIFGLPISKKSLVEQVVPGMRLFLFEFERRELWGMFEATSHGGLNIVPDAYSGGSFPAQVRFEMLGDCLSLKEDEFMEAISDNYFSKDKFKFDLSEDQVYQLSELFIRKCTNIMKKSAGSFYPEVGHTQHHDLMDVEDEQWMQEERHIARTTHHEKYRLNEFAHNAAFSPENLVFHGYPEDYVATSGGDILPQMKPSCLIQSDRTDMVGSGMSDYILQSSYQNDQNLEDRAVVTSKDRWDGVHLNEKELLYDYYNRAGYLSNQSELLTENLIINNNRISKPDSAGAFNSVNAKCHHLNSNTTNHYYIGEHINTNVNPIIDLANASNIITHGTKMPIYHKRTDVGNSPSVPRSIIAPVRARKILSSEIEADCYNEVISPLYSDSVNNKVSVWLRISGREKSPGTALNSKKEKLGEIVKPKGGAGWSAQERKMDLLCQCPAAKPNLDADGDNATMGEIIDGDCVEEEFVISFKRRRSNSCANKTESPDDTQIKRRRKLTRPVFNVSAESFKKHKEKKHEDLTQICSNENLQNLDCVQTSKLNKSPIDSMKGVMGRLVTYDGSDTGDDVQAVNSYQKSEVPIASQPLGTVELVKADKSNLCGSQVVNRLSIEPAEGDEAGKAGLPEASIASNFNQGVQSQVQFTSFLCDGVEVSNRKLQVDDSTDKKAIRKVSDDLGKGDDNNNWTQHQSQLLFSSKENAQNPNTKLELGNSTVSKVTSQLSDKPANGDDNRKVDLAETSPFNKGIHKQLQFMSFVQDGAGVPSTKLQLGGSVDSKVMNQLSDEVAKEDDIGEVDQPETSHSDKGLQNQVQFPSFVDDGMHFPSLKLLLCDSMDSTAISQLSDDLAKGDDNNEVGPEISPSNRGMPKEMQLMFVVPGGVQAPNIKLQPCDSSDLKVESHISDELAKRDDNGESGLLGDASSGNDYAKSSAAQVLP